MMFSIEFMNLKEFSSSNIFEFDNIFVFSHDYQEFFNNCLLLNQ